MLLKLYLRLINFGSSRAAVPVCLAVILLLAALPAAAAAFGGESFSTPRFDDTQIREAVGLIFRLLEGAFGALVMAVAGVMAIMAAAFGGYRAALGMLVVAVGAFILRSLVSLFFGTNFPVPPGS